VASERETTLTARGGQIHLSAVMMRGGTSKGLFFRGGVLPEDAAERDRVLLRALGGGDRFGSEIDGLGGATSSTSKAVVVSPSERPGSDVDYLFAQIGIREARVDWSGSCGNLAAAVGPFAIDEGLLGSVSDTTVVRIWQVNTQKEIVAHVPTEDGAALYVGDFSIDGVPYPSAPIQLDFIDPGGSITGTLFPTGRVVDLLEIDDDGSVEATLVDAGNPCVFVEAALLGLTALEPATELNANGAVLARLERIRGAAAVAMGLASSAADATITSPANPKIAVVARAASYTASDGRFVKADDADVVIRMLSMGRFHHALPGTGGVAAGAAALVPETTVARLVAELRASDQVAGATTVRIGNGAGVVPLAIKLAGSGDAVVVEQVTVWRSARRLMEGGVLVPAAG
jgi:2-methylaconitate cis-trans-isomerase PrpF